MATMNVLNSTGGTEAIEKPLTPGRSAAATSRPIAMSNEDKAVLDAMAASLVTIDGRVDGLETLITSTNTKLDTAITALQIIDNMVLAAGTANIGDVDVLTLGGQTPAFGSGANGATVLRTALATDSPGVIPLIAHDGADSGDPLKTGGRAVAGLSGLTLVAAADRTDSLYGVDGAQYVRPHCGLEDIVTGNATNTDGTSTSCIASSGAGVKTYLTSVVLCNTSATAITVDIKDGSTTKVSLPLPAGSGCIFNPPIPIPGTAATAWSFDPSAAATTVTCSMVGFKSKV
jgi:hypothetical protein